MQPGFDRSDTFKRAGSLPDTNPMVVDISAGYNLPFTITLKSAAAGRLIELSADGGTEYFTPVVDVTSATMQLVVVDAPVSHVRLRGTTNDTWSIR